MELAYLRDPKRSLPDRNLETYQNHRREIFWQITIPLVIGVLVVLALAVGILFGSVADVSRWADISIIWLILPSLLITLVFLIVTAALAYVVLLLINRLPPYMLLLQDFFHKIRDGVRRVSDKAVEPVLRVEGLKASWRALRRHF
jgi:hypothetical protein